MFSGKTKTLCITVAFATIALVVLLTFFNRSTRPEAKLVCECTGTAEQKKLGGILDIMRQDARRLLDQKKVRDIAVYYKDLKSGAWVAINKDEEFNPASLMKVPLMIECLESLQDHPELSKKHLHFIDAADWSAQQNIKPRETLQPGKGYSLNELIYRMIAYSDNNAVQLLLREFPTESLCHFLTDHHYDYQKDQLGFHISLGTYARVFEDLYEGKLLNRSLSTKALSYLAAEDFPQGMHAAVPPNIAVESKFGEKIFKDRNDQVIITQLHEVGIILDGDHPFLLGIMTSGKDLSALEAVIREITQDIFVKVELS